MRSQSVQGERAQGAPSEDRADLPGGISSCAINEPWYHEPPQVRVAKERLQAAVRGLCAQSIGHDPGDKPPRRVSYWLALGGLLTLSTSVDPPARVLLDVVGLYRESLGHSGDFPADGRLQARLVLLHDAADGLAEVLRELEGE